MWIFTSILCAHNIRCELFTLVETKENSSDAREERERDLERLKKNNVDCYRTCFFLWIAL
jgi:hypothetical protein